VPAGTIPSTPFCGTTLKVTPEHTVVKMVEMVAPGFSVMIMVNGLPAQFNPDVGYTV
jgi:hypothetical protein